MNNTTTIKTIKFLYKKEDKDMKMIDFAIRYVIKNNPTQNQLHEIRKICLSNKDLYDNYAQLIRDMINKVPDALELYKQNYII